MNNKNYTMTCLWVGEIKDENLKEVAKVMMWNCCPATYKDDEIIANAGLSMALDDEPHSLYVIIDGIHYNYDLTSKRVSSKMGKEIVELILKAVAEHKKLIGMNEIGKAMAECFVKHQTQEVGDYKFEFVSTDGRGVEWVKINVYKNGTLLFSPSMNVYADYHLHPEKLYNRCEEWLCWVVLKTLARQSEYEGTDLYDYLSNKCAEDGISLDVLDKHSEDILSK